MFTKHFFKVLVLFTLLIFAGIAIYFFSDSLSKEGNTDTSQASVVKK